MIVPGTKSGVGEADVAEPDVADPVGRGLRYRASNLSGWRVL